MFCHSQINNRLPTTSWAFDSVASKTLEHNHDIMECTCMEQLQETELNAIKMNNFS
jgi:hypothetical protein